MSLNTTIDHARDGVERWIKRLSEVGVSGELNTFTAQRYLALAADLNRCLDDDAEFAKQLQAEATR